MVFPKCLKINIVDKEKKPFLFSDIMIFVTLFASRKNNFHLGPFFTNNNGIVCLSVNDFVISAEAELETGLMDYCSYLECSEKVLIEIFDYKDLEKLIHGRETWGLVGKETLLYESKERLLERIKFSKNYLLEPAKIYLNFEGQEVVWGDIVTRFKEENIGTH